MKVSGFDWMTWVAASLIVKTEQSMIVGSVCLRWERAEDLPLWGPPVRRMWMELGGGLLEVMVNLLLSGE